MDRWDTLGLVLGLALLLMLLVTIVTAYWWFWPRRIESLIKSCCQKCKRKRNEDILPKWSVPATTPYHHKKGAYDDTCSGYALDRGATRRGESDSSKPTYVVEYEKTLKRDVVDGAIPRFTKPAESELQPVKVHGYFMKKHVFCMKELPNDTDKCKFALKKANEAYAKNCLPRTYTMIFVHDKIQFKFQIGLEAAKKRKNFSNAFTTDKSFYTMTFKLSMENDSYLFTGKGLRQLSLSSNAKRQIEHLNKTVEP